MTFVDDIDHFAKVVNARTARVTQSLAGRLLTEFVRASPVKTGRFRANWRVGINAPTRVAINRLDKSGEETIAAGLERIRGANAGDRVYISNNLPYARRIEYGWSHQAPYGIVRLQVTRIRSLVSKAVREAREQVK